MGYNRHRMTISCVDALVFFIDQPRFDEALRLPLGWLRAGQAGYAGCHARSGLKTQLSRL